MRSTVPHESPSLALPCDSTPALTTAGLLGFITGTGVTWLWVLTRGREDANRRSQVEGLVGGIGAPTTTASGGMVGAIVGVVVSLPQRNTLVRPTAGRVTESGPPAPPGSRMVIISPLSMACTWQTLLPSLSFQHFRTRHFCAGLLASVTMIRRSGWMACAPTTAAQASSPTTATTPVVDRIMELASFVWFNRPGFPLRPRNDSQSSAGPSPRGAASRGTIPGERFGRNGPALSRIAIDRADKIA